ncbi:RNase P subunit p30-domain-containing protein [Polychytrium aggregatum]|uniref:RNase P subunit p30-domain-containing protein n=1 Tax=Polychytrium aggregatum TaxID=110093 RepID=UPI0022FE015C|nr:RNase P subunit p30-domain-containing protein [Polychytrium aggregatum]KAI9204324.1 RNase P subunit p30-domain-containing protein [Polychytrium aggregatum]
MFYDLSVPYDKDASALGSRLHILKKLGYQCVALNTVVSGKSFATKAVIPKPIPIDGSGDVSASLAMWTSHHQGELPALAQLTRLTICVDDSIQNQHLNGNQSLLNSFDLIAIQPMTEKAFQAACGTFDIDIITLDFSCRLPFFIKATTVNLAIQRGVHFEISVGTALRDSSSRRHLINNAVSLIRASRGKNIILSGEAFRELDIRAPYDIMNLASIFGLNMTQAKESITKNGREVLLHAATRKDTFKGIISSELTDALQSTESAWKGGLNDDFISFADIDMEDE